MLGPLVGTALLASNLTTPYLVSAGLTALAVPLAIGLAVDESRASAASRPVLSAAHDG
jgi:hypothetical protein